MGQILNKAESIDCVPAAAMKGKYKPLLTGLRDLFEHIKLQVPQDEPSPVTFILQYTETTEAQYHLYSVSGRKEVFVKMSQNAVLILMLNTFGNR